MRRLGRRIRFALQDTTGLFCIAHEYLLLHEQTTFERWHA